MRVLNDYTYHRAIFLLKEFGYAEREEFGPGMFGNYQDNLYISIYVSERSSTINYCIEDSEWKSCSLYELTQLLNYQKYGSTALAPITVSKQGKSYTIQAMVENIPISAIREFAAHWSPNSTSSILSYENNLFINELPASKLQPCLDAIHSKFFLEYPYTQFRVENIMGQCDQPFSFERGLSLS